MTTASVDWQRYITDRSAFRREQITLPNGELYGDVEEEWQQEHIWQPWDSGRFQIMYLEMSRGLAKTTDAAMAAIEWALFEERSEILFFAGDAEQSGIASTIMAGMIRSNRALDASFVIGKERIHVPSTGTVCRVMTSDASTAFGFGGSARSLLVVCDEFWVWQNPLLWEAVISSTGKVNGRYRVLILSNAGIDGESDIAWKIRETCRAGEDSMMYFWRSEGPIAGWVTESWKDQQRRLLTPNGYRRLILNEWAASDSTAVEPQEWDALERAPAPYPDKVRGTVFVGLDASKSAKAGADTTAAVAVVRQAERQILIGHKIWEPSGRGGDVDLRQTVLPWLMDLKARYTSVRVLYDPYNMSIAAQLGREAGLAMFELTQTSEHLTQMATAMLDSIRTKALIVYDAPDLREHVLNAVLVESPRGVRLAKEKASRKVDGAVALAMALTEAREGAWFPAGMSFGNKSTSLWSEGSGGGSRRGPRIQAPNAHQGVSAWRQQASWRGLGL